MSYKPMSGRGKIHTLVRPMHPYHSQMCAAGVTRPQISKAQASVCADVSSMQVPQISEVQRTKAEIHALLNQYLELGMNQGYVTALSELPSAIIARARKADPITAKAILNKAMEWKDRLLAAYPDLAQRPAQFAVALETPEEYMKDRSGGKQAGREYVNRSGGVR